MRRNFSTAIAIISCLLLLISMPYVIKGEEALWPSENPEDYTIAVKESNRYAQYMDINRQTAYCIDLGKNAPTGSNNKNPSEVVIDVEGIVDNVEMMKKLLYYGYGGPGYDQTVHTGNNLNSAEAIRYALTAYNVHRAANGSYASEYGDRDLNGVADYWQTISGKELPDWEFELVQGAGEATLVSEAGIKWQRSPQFKLEGGPPGNSVHIPIVEPFQLRKVDTDEVYVANSTVEIKVNEAFWIEAPSDYVGVFETGNLESTMPTKMRVIVLRWPSSRNLQRVVTFECYKGKTSMSTPFLGFLSRVEVEKRDSEYRDILVNGAKFILLKKDAEGINYYFQRETKTWTTNKAEATILETKDNGKVGIEDLPMGEYYFEEVEAAPGYVLPENESERIFPTKLEDADKVSNVEVYNKKVQIPMDLLITKVDAQDKLNVLPKAEFILYKCTLNHGRFEDHNVPEQEGGCLTLYQSIISDENGRILLNELYSGHYLLIEIKAPDGYQLSREQWKILVNTREEVIEIYAQNGQAAWDISTNQAGEYLLLNDRPFKLPLTGIADLSKLSGLGMLFLVIGVNTYIKIKSKQKGEKV